MTLGRRVILVEGWSDRVDIRPDDLVVAVTAESLQDLRERGVAHVTPEQFGFLDRLADAERRLWPAQLDWLQCIGDLVAAGAPSQQLEARHFPWAYGWPLKAMIDRLIVANEECESVLAAVGGHPASVHLYEDPLLEEAETEVFGGWRDGSRARRLVWRQAAQTLHVPFTVDRGVMALKRRSPLRALARNVVGLIRARRTFPAPASASAPEKSRIVFLQSSSDVDSSIAELGKQGSACFFAEEGEANRIRLRRVTGGGESFSRSFGSVDWSSDPVAWRELISRAAAFLPERIMDAMQAGLASWLAARVPRYLAMVKTSRELLSEAEIGAVITSHLTTDVAAAMNGAAAAMPGVESALIAHGDSPEVAPAWDLHELKPYKHYFVPNREFADYFRERRARLSGNAAEVHEGSNRWAEYRTWRQAPPRWVNRWDTRLPRVRRKTPLALPRKPTVVYVTSWVPGHLRYLGKPDYTENATHDVQAAICDALASRPDLNVVMKLYPWHRTNSAIERHLRSVKSPVRVSRAPLRYWFASADAFIIDHPSTSLYQAAMVGIPVLALLYSRFQFRPAALAEFEGQTAPFSSPPEATELVRAFLARMPIAAPKIVPAFDNSSLPAQLRQLAERGR